MECTTLPCFKSTISTELLPKAATNNFWPSVSTAMWSILPRTAGRGMVCHRSGEAALSMAHSERKAPEVFTTERRFLGGVVPRMFFRGLLQAPGVEGIVNHHALAQEFLIVPEVCPEAQ